MWVTAATAAGYTAAGVNRYRPPLLTAAWVGGFVAGGTARAGFCYVGGAKNVEMWKCQNCRFLCTSVLQMLTVLVARGNKLHTKRAIFIFLLFYMGAWNRARFWRIGWLPASQPLAHVNRNEKSWRSIYISNRNIIIYIYYNNASSQPHANQWLTNDCAFLRSCLHFSAHRENGGAAPAPPWC